MKRRSLIIWGNRITVAVVAGLAGLIIGMYATNVSSNMEPVLQSENVCTVISPENYPYFGFPYSPGILVGNTLYISCHQGRDPITTELVDGGIEPETRQMMANINEVLKIADMDFKDVVSVTAYIANINDLPKFNAVYREYFPDDPQWMRQKRTQSKIAAAAHVHYMNC